MDKDDTLYKIVNIDGVDYRIERDENPFTHKKRYKVETNEIRFIFYGDDPEELLKSSLETEKHFEELRKSEFESDSENKFIIRDVKNLTLNNFKVIDEDGNEKVINKELKDVKELTLDDLLNLSDN